MFRWAIKIQTWMPKEPEHADRMTGELIFLLCILVYIFVQKDHILLKSLTTPISLSSQTRDGHGPQFWRLCNIPSVEPGRFHWGYLQVSGKTGKRFYNREQTSKYVVFLGHIVYAEKLMLFLKLIHDNWTEVLWKCC